MENKVYVRVTTTIPMLGLNGLSDNMSLTKEEMDKLTNNAFYPSEPHSNCLYMEYVEENGDELKIIPFIVRVLSQFNQIYLQAPRFAPYNDMLGEIKKWLNA